MGTKEDEFKQTDSQEDVYKRIKDCVDYAFEKVQKQHRDERTLMHFAMQKSRGFVNPVMVREEILKRSTV